MSARNDHGLPVALRIAGARQFMSLNRYAALTARFGSGRATRYPDKALAGGFRTILAGEPDLREALP
jgi:hypothetical protein